MKPSTRIPLRSVPRVIGGTGIARPIHSACIRLADVAPVVGTGPPPDAPSAPAAATSYQRVERRRRQAEVLKLAREARDAAGSKKNVLRKRFWTDVGVREVDGRWRRTLAHTR